MKKITFLLVAFMATMFCGCSSDDDDDSSNLLEGTTWVADDGEERFTLAFQKSSVTLTYVYDTNGDGIINAADGKGETITGTYTLDGNNVSVKTKDTIAHGTVSGNQMTLSADGDSITYTKK